MRKRKADSEPSLQDIQQQIETLKQKAEAIRKKEMAEVVARIKDAIKHYGLTASDLGLVGRAASKARAGAKPGRRGAAKKSAKAVVVKFRDENGNTWGGRGKRPDWLRNALAAGKQLQDFAVR